MGREGVHLWGPTNIASPAVIAVERPAIQCEITILLAVIPSGENTRDAPPHAGGGSGARTDVQTTSTIYAKLWLLRAPHALGTGCWVSTRQWPVCSGLAF